MNIQVFSEDYKEIADSNILSKIEARPLRGMVYDRDGRILVNNAPVFDIMMTLNQMELGPADTTELANLFDITVEDIRNTIADARARGFYSAPYLFVKQLKKEDFAKIQDYLPRFKGLSVEPRTIREYPHQSLANVLGYVKQVTKEFLDSDTTEYYKQRDLIGRSGIERYYEQELRGKRGVYYVLKNARREVKGKFKDGAYDELPESGSDLVSSIDLELQQYAEQLMQNKRGAIVAIEPSTGEILTMLSAPSYDPNLLTGEGRKVSKNYSTLLKNKGNPLFNRAMQSRYPPGSTFKTVMSLIGMQEGVLDTTYTRFVCGGERVKCHAHPSPLSIAGSLQHSCNPWYYKAIRKIILQDKKVDAQEDLHYGLSHWKEKVQEFGLGRRLGIDLPFEKGGLVPGPDFYTRAYGGRPWKISNIYSISIGQGEVLAMPIQLANLAATIANRGWYYTPHIIKDVGGKGPKEIYKEKNRVSIDRSYFDYTARAMAGVKTAPLAMMNDIPIAGKTGTAQNPHGKDHSIFMAFAPVHDPKIAIAVYVENAGFGGTWAAPIASLVMEKYLKGQVDRDWLEQYVLNAEILVDEEE
ncbi:penicillin-binding protein 2 [Algivirga pacifica]|uniref:Penicillin-binding protein 2 n=2 Tax=Algivirga pacifica TaxID=1162670 RepID=A0ABP9D7X5_9BACT